MMGLIGYFAGICLAFCFLSQVVRTYRLKRADDVSMYMLILSILSVIGYEVYAWKLGLMPLVIMSAVFLLLILFVLIFKIRYDILGKGFASQVSPSAS